jgi:CheY-like chemotaxis protein
MILVPALSPLDLSRSLHFPYAAPLTSVPTHFSIQPKVFSRKRKGAAVGVPLATTMTNLARLKVIIAVERKEDANLLKQDLESLGHRVQICHELSDAVFHLRQWQPDLVVTEERFGRESGNSELRLAEYCRVTEDRVNGWPGTRTLLLISNVDWDCFKRAQAAGAHVIVKGTSFDAAIRYIQVVADDLVTDRVLGPTLVGLHRFKGDAPCPRCEDCEWVGALVSYGSSQTDVQQLTPVRATLLNVLLFRRRGQSPSAIVDLCNESFLKRTLQKHVLRESAVKMEMTRLRQDLSRALEAIGAPYSGQHFLPPVPHGASTYCLAGNRRLIHIPVSD